MFGSLATLYFTDFNSFQRQVAAQYNLVSSQIPALSDMQDKLDFLVAAASSQIAGQTQNFIFMSFMKSLGLIAILWALIYTLSAA
jgi:hypothetical protein